MTVDEGALYAWVATNLAPELPHSSPHIGLDDGVEPVDFWGDNGTTVKVVDNCLPGFTGRIDPVGKFSSGTPPPPSSEIAEGQPIPSRNLKVNGSRSGTFASGAGRGLWPSWFSHTRTA